jgi:hypothetical protein
LNRQDTQKTGVDAGVLQDAAPALLALVTRFVALYAAGGGADIEEALERLYRDAQRVLAQLRDQHARAGWRTREQEEPPC